jgi:hypothetical protein
VSNEAEIRSLLAGTQFDDPRLYDLISSMLDDLYQVYYQLNPPRSSRNLGATGSVSGASSVSGFTATVFTNNLRLTWSPLDDITSYEIRYHFGSSTDWDTGTSLLTTSTLSADINPLTLPLVYGNHTFLLKGITASGLYSTVASSVVVNIPQIPAVTITSTIIDNFVLLKWTVPTSVLDIAHYNVYKDGVLLGKMDGTFEAIFETTAGTFLYKVEAEDIVGNIGTSSTLSLTVKAPPDYQIQDSRNSTFSGTKVSAILLDGKLYTPVDIVETFTAHFTARGWTSYNSADVAGYPLMIQPTPTSTASYEEVVDYGSLLSNTIITALYSQNLISGAVTVTIKIATSTDNITYTAFTSGASLFSASMRYAKFRLEFVGSNDKALCTIDSLQYRLDVKREVDSGSISALSTDATGTQVTFNKTFKSVDSFTATANSTEPITVLYSSLTTTGAKVYVVDSTGNRISKTVSWKARGIV